MDIFLKKYPWISEYINGSSGKNPTTGPMDVVWLRNVQFRETPTPTGFNLHHTKISPRLWLGDIILLVSASSIICVKFLKDIPKNGKENKVKTTFRNG